MAHHHQQYYRSPFGDTTLTKVFVGGLAWETQTDVMRNYFDQFGEILEAVIITDKNTGKSKGYGFVTFREPESARRACAEPNPVIDGRRANCNIASLGRPRPSPPPRGRNQMGNMYGGTSHGGSPLSAYPPMVAPPLQPPMPPPSPVMYPPYGYTAYPTDYGYNQGIMYNQASQYYNNQQLSSSTPPYNYYGYSSLIQRAPPTLYSMNNPQLAAHHQRALQSNYLYYPQPSQFDAAQQYPFLQPRIAINPSSSATPQTSTGTEAAPATSTSSTA